MAWEHEDEAHLRVVDREVATHSRGGRVRYEAADRQETLLRGDGQHPLHLEVIARHLPDVAALHAEAALLQGLASRGLQAVPAVIDLQADGYVRETGRPLRSGTGRRADRDGAPADPERHARARAREDMDLVLEQLHAQGLVLGLSAGEGLALRGDGTVMVDELRGLHPSDAIHDRIADQQWLDSVLQDQGRTLRRRVEPAMSSGPQDHEPERCTTASDDPWLQPAPGTVLEADARVSGATGFAVPWGEALYGPPAVPGSGRDRGGRRSRLVRRSAPARIRGGSRDVGGLLSRVPLIAIVGGVSLLAAAASLTILGAFEVSGADGAGPGGSDQPAISRPSLSEPTAAPDEDPTPAPSSDDDGTSPSPATAAASHEASLEDPALLVADLVDRRHDYVLAVDAEPVAVPGSPADRQDQAARAEYSGSTITGWETTVHTATVLEHDRDAGTVVLEAQIEEEAHSVRAADGAVRSIPSSGPQRVQLHLESADGTWKVREVVPV